MKTYAHDPRFIFNGRDGSFPDAVVIREIWCENVYEVFESDFNDTGIAVDIGANIGSFSLYAGKLGAKKVICVEPEPHNIDLLIQNIGANKHNIPDCEFVFEHSGIGDGKFTKAFITNEHGGSRVSFTKEASVKPITLISLEQLFKTHELEYVDVLKIDVEGMEGNILINAPEHILNLCRYITVEYDQHSNDLGAIVEKLNKTHSLKTVGKAGGMIFGKRY